jgi:hypothetical protein
MNLKEEIYQVYADLHMKDFWKAKKIRNLDWRSTPVSIDEAYSAFINVCKSYNKFKTESVFNKLKFICQDYDVSVSLAREGSPAIYLYTKTAEDAQYIFNKLKEEHSMHIDELDFDNATTIRMWWD